MKGGCARFCSGLALLALLTSLTPAHAFSDAADMRNQSTALSLQIAEKANQASEAVADGNYATASSLTASLLTLTNQKIALVDQAVAENLLDLKQAAAIRKLYQAGVTVLTSTNTLLQGGAATKLQVLTGLQKAVASVSQGEKRLQNGDRAFPHMVLASTKTDLYRPGSAVCWAVYGLPKSYLALAPGSCPIVATFTNPANALGIQAIASNPQIQPFNPCSGKFCFLAGEDMGGGQVSLKNNATGEESSRILFNYGVGRVHPSTGQPMATLSGTAQYAGGYAGAYSGVFNISEDCGGGTQAVSGSVALTISAGGAIAVSAPGVGAGKVSPLGTYASGGLGVSDTSVSFRGGIINSRLNDSAVITGGWSGRNPCGTGAGTWQATRN